MKIICLQTENNSVDVLFSNVLIPTLADKSSGIFGAAENGPENALNELATFGSACAGRISLSPFIPTTAVFFSDSAERTHADCTNAAVCASESNSSCV